MLRNDMESSGLSRKDAQSRNKWRRRINNNNNNNNRISIAPYGRNFRGAELRGQPANPGSPGKMAVKTVRALIILSVSGEHINK